MTEVLGTLLGNIPTALIAAVGFGLIRVVTGWAENAFRDGKVEAFEIKQLIGTMAGYFGLILVTISGLNVDPAMAGGYAYILDMVRTALKAKNQVEAK